MSMAMPVVSVWMAVIMAMTVWVRVVVAMLVAMLFTVPMVVINAVSRHRGRAAGYAGKRQCSGSGYWHRNCPLPRARGRSSVVGRRMRVSVAVAMPARPM